MLSVKISSQNKSWETIDGFSHCLYVCCMDYAQTLTWMFKRLPMFQRQGSAAYKKDLGNIKLMDGRLDHPHEWYKTIHVAGTNGKGSTSHLLASILQEAGYKVGLYTSPHLKDFRERIRVDGQMATEGFVIDFIDQHQAFLEENKLSFFELTVGMALQYFKEEQVDVAVIEVGLGGRLDATNIISPEISVITNIGLDHTQFLGESLKEIAGEKAGIIKKGIPVVVGERQKETTTVFVQKAVAMGCPIFFASEEKDLDYEVALKGSYQKNNVKTVLKTIEVLQGEGAFLISDFHISQGLKNVVQNTGLQGRWQVLGEAPKIICDTGHNREGLQLVMEQLKTEAFDQLHIVLGVVADKDLDTILPLFPENAIYYFCKPHIPRGLDVAELEKKAKDFNLFGQKFNSVKEAFQAAKGIASADDLIFVGGSTFVVAEVL